MHDEDGFLAAIRQVPADDHARLVFADWLDEQDSPSCKTKAAFIRLELRMADLPEQSLTRKLWTNKLQKLALGIDPTWLAVVSHPRLEACRMAFRFECPKKWESLTPTSADPIRYCESCDQHVHYCSSLNEARQHAERGHCVALSRALVRRPNDLFPPGEVLMGMPLPPVAPVDATPETLLFDLPGAPAAPQWVPAPESTARDRRTPKRKKRRSEHRNIQREDWEGEG